MPQIVEVCLKHVGSPAFWPAALLTGQLQVFQWQSRNAALHSRLWGNVLFLDIVSEGHIFFLNLYVHSACVVTLKLSSPLLSGISHVFRTYESVMLCILFHADNYRMCFTFVCFFVIKSTQKSFDSSENINIFVVFFSEGHVAWVVILPLEHGKSCVTHPKFNNLQQQMQVWFFLICKSFAQSGDSSVTWLFFGCDQLSWTRHLCCWVMSTSPASDTSFILLLLRN